jgi:hypothetical protein
MWTYKKKKKKKAKKHTTIVFTPWAWASDYPHQYRSITNPNKTDCNSDEEGKSTDAGVDSILLWAVTGCGGGSGMSSGH